MSMKLTPTAVWRRRTSPEPGARIDCAPRNKNLRAAVARDRDLDALGRLAGSRRSRGAIEMRGRGACGQSAPKPGEARLHDLLSHEALEPHAVLRGRFEGSPPFHEAGIVAGHRTQPHARDVISERRLRLQNAIAEASLCIGKKQKLLANARTVLKPKVADAADLIARFAVLDRARRDGRMPSVMAVEVSQNRPHRLDRRADHRAAADIDPRQRLKRAFNAARPAAKTLRPIESTRPSSRSGAASNSAVHSAKV